ncbi:MAG TPA: four helix bundle protein [Gemmatimonadaceae bacterium]|nr:four helix bundle protein [Gemmatimonadaceae bacterium]
MARLLSYRDLDVWKRSMDLVVDVHEVTRALPPSERYGLTSQLRRAAVSVAANIAEGNGRTHRKEYAHHVSIARGSILELITCLEIAQRLGYLSAALVAPVLQQADTISRMLLMLLRALEKPARSAR